MRFCCPLFGSGGATLWARLRVENLKTQRSQRKAAEGAKEAAGLLYGPAKGAQITSISWISCSVSATASRSGGFPYPHRFCLLPTFCKPVTIC